MSSQGECPAQEVSQTNKRSSQGEGSAQENSQSQGECPAQENSQTNLIKVQSRYM